MKSEAQIKERLAELYDVAKIKDPSLEKYTEPPIVKINDESLRFEIYELLWCLDLL